MFLERLLAPTLVAAMITSGSSTAATFVYVDENQAPTSEITIGNGCARMVDMNHLDDYSIFNSKKATMAAIDKRRGELYEFNEQQMKGVGQRMRSRQQDMMKQLQKMPGLTNEQRKMMEQALG